MTYSKDSISTLRKEIKKRLSEKRYSHTLGVEQMAMYLGDIILPDKIDELCIAALLHDVTKELSYDEQIRLLNESGANCSDEDISVKPAIHSISAVPLIKKDFHQYATSDVLSAVANHTLGADNMSIFDEIIFISDYAEAGRTYPACQSVRKFILENINKNNSHEYNIKSLHSASLNAIRNTVDSLVRRDEPIHSKTLIAEKYFNGLIKELSK